LICLYIFGKNLKKGLDENQISDNIMNDFSRWIFINIVLPLSPFLLRLFITFIGINQKLSFDRIAELPEILFYSIFVCVITLNINLNGEKKLFESFLRLFLFIIIILDFITLGMIYSGNFGPNTFTFSLVSALIPAIIAPIYKLYYLETSKES